VSEEGVAEFDVDVVFSNVEQIEWLATLVHQHQPPVASTQQTLAGNVADMSRHVADDTLCRSNFGQMGPCC